MSDYQGWQRANLRCLEAARTVERVFTERIEDGPWAVEPFELTEADVRWAQMRDAVHGSRETDGLHPGRYVKLVHLPDRPFDSTVVMSTTSMEVVSQAEAAHRARGHVLVAGLGLGVATLAIQWSHDVERVDVIERAPEVIRLVGSRLPLRPARLDNLGIGTLIMAGDVDIWEPPAGRRYGAIYFDIWSHIPNEDNWEQIKRLRRRYRRWAAPGAWIGAWREADARRGAGK